MDTFNSPLEALALAYVGFDLLTLVSNIWTWVAVITAAYSFWKIRATSLPKFNPHRRNPDVNQPTPPPTTTQKAAEPALALTPSGSLPAAEGDGIAKGTKFSLYYESKSESEGGEGELAWTGQVDGSDAGGGECCDGWETIRRMRLNGHTSWYSFQDLTMLDGNVVRLWHDSDASGGQKAPSQMVLRGNCYYSRGVKL